MSNIPAPVRDIQFLVEDVLKMQKHYESLNVFSELDIETFMTIIEESSKFLLQYAAPLNRNADEQGCRIEGQQVFTPNGFKELYQKYCRDGWNSLDAEEQYGGQGLSFWLQTILGELNTYYCPGWSNYPGLTHGCRELLQQFASETLKQKFIPKLTSGQWSGTMCLTEPHCGTDLGLLNTQAIPKEDGCYSIRGTKIFITSGEHDLCENIVHLVLARLPDSPKGTKGISIFAVPKFLSDSHQITERNNLSASSIEHKMGLNGSATCVMNFDDATGYLIGEVNQGLTIMFTMMNGARLNTGIQGLSAIQGSYENSSRYAKERLQMRSPNGPLFPEKNADPIIVHPDVRRMLLTQKALAEGGRALAYFTTQQIEVTKYSQNKQQVENAERLVAFLTPVVKGFLTEVALEATNFGIQIYGGHGYIREHGQEQWYRDAKIFTLYEGTTGIQALDLVGRKLLREQKGNIGTIAQIIEDYINQSNHELSEQLAEYLSIWKNTTATIVQASQQNVSEVGAASVDYMMLSGYVIIAYFWSLIYDEAMKGGRHGDNFYQGKIKTAQFYFAKILPRCHTLTHTIKNGSKTLMNIEINQF